MIKDFGVYFDKENMRINYWYKIDDKVYYNIRQISKEEIDDTCTALMELCNRIGEEFLPEKIEKGLMVSYVSMVHTINKYFFKGND